MHLKKLLQILSYRLMIVLMCGTLASAFINFIYTADSINNIECAFIISDRVSLPDLDIKGFREGPQMVFFNPENKIVDMTYTVPYPLKINTGLPNTS